MQLNFDTFGAALICELSLLLMNDWPILMEALEVTSGTASARIFCIAFWVINIVVALNVVTAFMVESFGIQREKRLMAAHRAIEKPTDEWAVLLASSGIDFSEYRISRQLGHSDVLDDVYRDELRQQFPDTFR